MDGQRKRRSRGKEKRVNLYTHTKVNKSGEVARKKSIRPKVYVMGRISPR